VQGDEREDQRLQVLDKVVENAKTLRISGFGHVLQRPYLRRLHVIVSDWILHRKRLLYLEGDMLIAHPDL
jgi:hypothetical protein